MNVGGSPRRVVLHEVLHATHATCCMPHSAFPRWQAIGPGLPGPAPGQAAPFPANPRTPRPAAVDAKGEASRSARGMRRRQPTPRRPSHLASRLPTIDPPWTPPPGYGSAHIVLDSALTLVDLARYPERVADVPLA